jgi:hypothetical protein
MNSEYKVIIEKDDMKFVKTSKTQYQMIFSMQNRFIHLPDIINFDLIKLMQDLNPDIYEQVNLEKLNEKEAVITMLFRHFFADLGLPQEYSYLHIERSESDNMIRFQFETVYSERPKTIPAEAQLIHLRSVSLLCDILNPHKVNICCSVNIPDDDHLFPPFMEKFVGMMTYKIFNRLKQFIENYRIT